MMDNSCKRYDRGSAQTYRAGIGYSDKISFGRKSERGEWS